MIFPDTMDEYVEETTFEEKADQMKELSQAVTKKGNFQKRMIMLVTIFSLLLLLGSLFMTILLWTSIGYSVQFTETQKIHITEANTINSEIASTLGIRVDQTNKKLPKLVVHLTIDGFRNDNVHIFRHRFGTSGFNFLFDYGTYYRNARYDYANTFTAVGHASLFTGCPSSKHGIVSNHWYIEEGEFRACQDDRYTREVSNMEPKPLTDSSPINLQSTTYGDELLSRSPSSKYFTVSLKNRAAILSGGHQGKAFWFSPFTGRMISSNYYYKDEYPGWVSSWNKKNLATRFSEMSWNFMFPETEYLYGEGHTAPDFGKKDKGYFRDNVYCTHYGDEFLLDFAKTLIERENLGKRDVTDVLGISFSSLDCIGHKYGVTSRYYEDNVYHLDTLMENLFRFLGDHMGITNTLIVLSGDHGMDLGFKHSSEKIGMKSEVILDLTGELNGYLNKKYDLQKDTSLIIGVEGPGVYVNTKRLNEVFSPMKISYDDVIEELKTYLKQKIGVRNVLSRKDFRSGSYEKTKIMKMVENSYHLKRSGDLYIISEQYSQIMRTHTKESSHGSPYTYDTQVPIFFYGQDIPKGRIIGKRVSPLDIAPTISAFLGIDSPSGAEGSALDDVLKIHQE